MTELLFVYGSLRPELAPEELQPLLARFSSLGSGTTPGRLYDLGPYCGAVLDPAGAARIHGFLWRIPPEMLPTLDEYEGYSEAAPDAGLYVRRLCTVQGGDGEEYESWIYVYNGEVANARPIPSGDYGEYMEAQAMAEEPLTSFIPSLETVRQLESKYLVPTYARNPVMFVRGKGSTLYDENGKAYLDFISGIGVSVLGYDHPRVRRVLKEQGNLLHTSNLYFHPYQGQLAERLAKAAGMARVFFSNTGTEAVEGALKLARAWQKKQGRTEKTEFVALTNSFHGRTMGALSVTAQEKYRKPFEPLVPGVQFLDPNDCEGDFAAARAAINERTAAVIIETIQGESGVRPVNDPFLKVVREACDRTDTLFILDEVQCGLGRTGRLFAFENTSVRPDLLCVAKPLGLGVPLGGFIVSEKAADGLQPGDHGTTFGGGPLACRLSLEFMEMLQEGALMERVTEVGAYFRKELARIQSRHPQLVREVRGLGLMVGAELTFSGKNVIAKMLERGFLMNCTHDTVLRFLPPYIIRKAEIRAMLAALEEVILDEAQQHGLS
ncbi:MAG: acetylornithine/succinylornithine family transaminase [Blastocatellia bacterium]|nr:acetylornithine/succinylornithine family transaminase [Blastocatellia bacterium]